MIATVSLVVGLLSVVGTTTTTSLLRKRGVEEDRVFEALVSRTEWVRSQLYTDTGLQNQCDAALDAGGDTFTTQYIVDHDGDGNQDLPFAIGDTETPIITCVIQAAPPFNDPLKLVRVQMTAQWAGVGGQRQLALECLIGNRTGYKPD